MTQRLLLVMLVVTAGGCGTAVKFRVPIGELQRQAALPIAERGAQVRVIPFEPQTTAVGENGGAAAIPIESDGGGVSVDLEVPLQPGYVRGGYRPTARGVPARAVAAPGRVVGGWRGSVPATRVASTTHAAPRLPSVHHGGGGGHGGGGAAIAGAIVGVVLIAALASAAADAASDSEARADSARAFDGWVTVDHTRVVHVKYRNGSERSIALSELVASDLADALYAYLDESEGPVVPLSLPFGAPPAPGLDPNPPLAPPVRPSQLPSPRPPDPPQARPAPSPASPPTSTLAPDFLS